jgi:hypothetical protein
VGGNEAHHERHNVDVPDGRDLLQTRDHRGIAGREAME